MVVSKAMRLRAFLVALAIVHFPFLGDLLPSLRMAMLLPVLFWVNVPGVPLGMALVSPSTNSTNSASCPAVPWPGG